ncbi:hypothetical protein WCP94_003839 [Bilophila wadsworthia]
MLFLSVFLGYGTAVAESCRFISLFVANIGIRFRIFSDTVSAKKYRHETTQCHFT